MNNRKDTTRKKQNPSQTKVRDIPKSFKKTYLKLCRQSAHWKPKNENSEYVKYPEGCL